MVDALVDVAVQARLELSVPVVCGRRLLRELEAAEQAIDSARSGRTGLFRISADPM